MKNKEKIENILGVTLLGLIFLTIVFVIFFLFGGIILSLLGMEYDSFWSLAKFFAIYLIIGIFLDLFVESFFKVLKELRGLTHFQYRALYFIIDVPLNMVIIGILESSINGVSCSLLAAFLFSIISNLFGAYLNRKLDT